MILLSTNKIEHALKCVQTTFYALPFYQHPIAAGFPNQASEEVEDTLDLNELLIRHPAATFFLRARDNSMIKAGIFQEDILIVDRSLEWSNGKILVVLVSGEVKVRRFSQAGKKVQLVAEHPAYRPIDITSESDAQILGVVTSVIHPV